MGTTVRRVNYFYVTVEDQPGEGFRCFTRLAEMDQKRWTRSRFR